MSQEGRAATAQGGLCLLSTCLSPRGSRTRTPSSLQPFPHAWFPPQLGPLAAPCGKGALWGQGASDGWVA